MFKKRSYKNYDDEDKGSKQKIKKVLLIALAIIVGTIVISLALTDMGYFPGNLLNRFAISSYLKDNYSEYDYKIKSYKGYDDENDMFVYNCVVNGQKCEISANNFMVLDDGYYDNYCRNKYFEEITNNYMNDYLNNKWSELYSDYTSSWECFIDIPLEDTAFPSVHTDQEISSEMILDACKKYGGSFTFTVNIYGNSLTMEEYRKVVFYAINILQKEMDNRPSSMQVFYYRTNDNEPVMQYESTVETYQFDYSEQGVFESSNMHKYVEVPDDIRRNNRIYNIVKDIVIIVISFTVVSLSILWCVRKYKKYKKYKQPSQKEDELSNNENNIL